MARGIVNPYGGGGARGGRRGGSRDLEAGALLGAECPSVDCINACQVGRRGTFFKRLVLLVLLLTAVVLLMGAHTEIADVRVVPSPMLSRQEEEAGAAGVAVLHPSGLGMKAPTDAQSSGARQRAKESFEQITEPAHAHLEEREADRKLNMDKDSNAEESLLQRQREEEAEAMQEHEKMQAQERMEAEKQALIEHAEAVKAAAEQDEQQLRQAQEAEVQAQSQREREEEEQKQEQQQAEMVRRKKQKAEEEEEEEKGRQEAEKRRQKQKEEAKAELEAEASRALAEREQRKRDEEQQQEQARKAVEVALAAAAAQEAAKESAEVAPPQREEEEAQAPPSPPSPQPEVSGSSESMPSALSSGLSSALAGKLALWLRADEGVEADPSTGAVLRWRDMSGRGRHFSPPASTALRAQGLSKLADEVRDFRDEHGVPAIGEGLPPGVKSLLAELVTQGKAQGGQVPGGVAEGPLLEDMGRVAPGGRRRLPLVRFPGGPLVCSDASLVLQRDGMTLFFALAPHLLADGDHAPGQRFFGTYPSGQFRFRDGLPGLKLGKQDYTLPATARAEEGGLRAEMEVRHGRHMHDEAVFSQLAYRLDAQGVHMSRDGAAWQEALSRMGQAAPPLSASGGGGNGGGGFSERVAVVLGGAQISGGGFLGDVGEVLVFDSALPDGDARAVQAYLADKWGTTLQGGAWHGAGGGEEEGKEKRGVREVGEAAALALGGAQEGQEVQEQARRKEQEGPGVDAEVPLGIGGGKHDKVAAPGVAEGVRVGEEADEAEIHLSRREKQYLRQQKAKDEQKKQTQQQREEHEAREEEDKKRRAREEEEERRQHQESEALDKKERKKKGQGNKNKPDVPPSKHHIGSPDARHRHQGAAGAAGAAGGAKAHDSDASNPAPPLPADKVEAAAAVGDTAGEEGGCVVDDDARVENWKPPPGAALRPKLQWTDEQAASMGRIRAFEKGGKQLKDLIHAEVTRLKILRHDLFC